MNLHLLCRQLPLLVIELAYSNICILCANFATHIVKRFACCRQLFEMQLPLIAKLGGIAQVYAAVGGDITRIVQSLNVDFAFC